MRYFDHFSWRMTFPQLPDHPPRFGGEVPSFTICSVWAGHVVVPRVCRLQDLGMHHEPGEVLPAQKTQDTIGLPFVLTRLHKKPPPARVFNVKFWLVLQF